MTFVSKTADYIVCEASHLTNFAILINPNNDVVRTALRGVGNSSWE